MMGLLGSLLNTAVDIVTLPISVVSDIVEVGTGELEESKTKEHIKDILKDVTDVFDDTL